MQDALRKRCPPSKTPGTWAGSVVLTDKSGVYVSVSQERWDKTKQILLSMEEELEAVKPELLHKQLLSVWGFLIYVASMYASMVPYLKGIHLTIEHWRDDRDEEGWPNQRALREQCRRTNEEILATLDDHLTMTAILSDLQEVSDNSPLSA